MGLNRSLQASTVASRTDFPSSCNCFANSMIKIEFLLQSPTSTTNPISVKRLIPVFPTMVPTSAEKIQTGTTRMTAKGKPQLSYWADKTKNTKTTDRGNTNLLRMCLLYSALVQSSINILTTYRYAFGFSVP